MPKFKKKPVVIDAIRASEALDWAKCEWNKMPNWLREAYDRGIAVFAPASILIKTLEGDHTAQRDDWIIRGIKGELYPCKPDIFDATYEAMPDNCPAHDTQESQFLSADDICALRTALGLLNSMVLSGEQHSDTSVNVLQKATKILTRK
jgi:hypothetical protein